ncbi:CPW-WPC domain [Babesia duncani]|uniref:CPW-WPC domain n=1 Tax=Babesia duncani TaxID=323732 RepID=A0AAD9PHE8_9APIC|nr:CPW-WPC domain [Babesia duncani]
MAFSHKCQAPWPCLNFCVRDYSSFCPKGWTRDDDFCKLDGKNETGPCGTNIKIQKNWNIYAKQELEYKCRVLWPCRQSPRVY